MCLCVIGCEDNTSKISDAFIKTKELATESLGHFTVIEEEANRETPDLELIKVEASAGKTEQATILMQTNKGLKSVPKVSDDGVSLSDLLWLGGTVILVVAVIAFLTFNPLGRGICAAIGGVFTTLAAMLPSKSTNMGKLMAKTTDPNDKFDEDNLITALRQADPVAEKAMLRERQKKDVAKHAVKSEKSV
jgi:hypothetical protein